MRLLTKPEIDTLLQQSCSCDNWSNVEVCDDFSAEYVRNVRFSGYISLGKFTGVVEYKSGFTTHTGIYNAALHNCIVEDNVLISNIGNCIANYHIKQGCCIENVGLLAVEGKSAFGNGTIVNVLNEAGGREVKIFDKLSSHVAYMLAFYRHRPGLIEKIDALIDRYVESQTAVSGIVEANAVIRNSKIIRNVKIGESAIVENVQELYNGTIVSTATNPAYVGTGVIARHFIIGSGSKVYDNAILDKCFVGESCEVGKQYSAVDSLFFCNSQLLHGEATAVFGGPYTTTHHKSTLLIGCMFSFYNAGSGTNQSNHMYKLGPVHQGVFERGVKTGSDSYVMLEARAGAFSLILGHHEQHFDTSGLPFSYILEDGGRSTLIPAVNFQTVGTQRDAQKWPKRDGRKGDEKQDQIIFDLLNPYIIQKVRNGIEVLKKLSEKTSEYHSYKSVRIKNIFVSKGIQVYQSAIQYYVGKSILEKLVQTDGFDNQKWKPQTKTGKNSWVDLSGLILPQELLEKECIELLEAGKFQQIEALNALFGNIYDDYKHYEWTYICSLLEEMTGKTIEQMLASDIVALLEQYRDAYNNLTEAILSDAGKEFNTASMVSFGIDGDKETQQLDFTSVRGRYEDNLFVKDIAESREAEINKINQFINILSKK